MGIAMLSLIVAVAVLVPVAVWQSSVIQSKSEQMDRLKVELAQWRHLSEMGLESIKSMSEQKEKALQESRALKQAALEFSNRINQKSPAITISSHS